MEIVNKINELLKLTNVSKIYGKKSALSNVNLTIGKGKIVGLLGPNGSGKTTLLKLVNGLLQATTGEILINGNKPGITSKSIISYLPERTYLNNWMKVSEILEFFKDFYSDFNIEKAKNMLNSLNIDENDKLRTMSKGTKEKVQLVLVMSRNAQIYLLDEPIGGVDPATRDYILNTIISNYSENSTVIISTHLIQDVEKIFDDIIFLSKGEIVLHDSVDNVREQKQKSIDELFREVFKC
jgi:ABC-2 type transport system ATP-binding protein